MNCWIAARSASVFTTVALSLRNDRAVRNARSLTPALLVKVMERVLIRRHRAPVRCWSFQKSRPSAPVMSAPFQTIIFVGGGSKAPAGVFLTGVKSRRLWHEVAAMASGAAGQVDIVLSIPRVCSAMAAIQVRKASIAVVTCRDLPAGLHTLTIVADPSGSQVGKHQASETCALQRCLHHDHGGIEHQATDRRRLDAGRLEPAWPLLGAIERSSVWRFRSSGRRQQGGERRDAQHGKRRLEQGLRTCIVPRRCRSEWHVSSPSAAMSTRLLLVESRMSMNGYFSRKSASRGSSQPTANVPTAPTVDVAQMAALEAVEHVGHAVEGTLQWWQQRHAFVGDHQPTRQPAEKQGAEPLFQELHLMTDGCLRDA